MATKNYHWHLVTSLYELENGFLKEREAMPIDIAGKSLCLARYNDKYFALDDRCPHAGGSIGTGWCDSKGNVICPYHRIGFRLTDGGPATGKGYYVNSYPTELREDGLYVGIKKKWWEF
jgi:nitrite reductase/ring-hydroxylating ferredoxin subunit